MSQVETVETAQKPKLLPVAINNLLTSWWLMIGLAVLSIFLLGGKLPLLGSEGSITILGWIVLSAVSGGLVFVGAFVGMGVSKGMRSAVALCKLGSLGGLAFGGIEFALLLALTFMGEQSFLGGPDLMIYQLVAGAMVYSLPLLPMIFAFLTFKTAGTAEIEEFVAQAGVDEEIEDEVEEGFDTLVEDEDEAGAEDGLEELMGSEGFEDQTVDEESATIAYEPGGEIEDEFLDEVGVDAAPTAVEDVEIEDEFDMGVPDADDSVSDSIHDEAAHVEDEEIAADNLGAEDDWLEDATEEGVGTLEEDALDEDLLTEETEVSELDEEEEEETGKKKKKKAKKKKAGGGLFGLFGKKKKKEEVEEVPVDEDIDAEVEEDVVFDAEEEMEQLAEEGEPAKGKKKKKKKAKKAGGGLFGFLGKKKKKAEEVEPEAAELDEFADVEEEAEIEGDEALALDEEVEIEAASDEDTGEFIMDKELAVETEDELQGVEYDEEPAEGVDADSDFVALDDDLETELDEEPEAVAEEEEQPRGKKEKKKAGKKGGGLFGLFGTKKKKKEEAAALVEESEEEDILAGDLEEDVIFEDESAIDAAVLGEEREIALDQADEDFSGSITDDESVLEAEQEIGEEEAVAEEDDSLARLDEDVFETEELEAPVAGDEEALPGDFDEVVAEEEIAEAAPDVEPATKKGKKAKKAKKQRKKKGKVPVLAILIVLILAGGAAAGGYFMLPDMMGLISAGSAAGAGLLLSLLLLVFGRKKPAPEPKAKAALEAEALAAEEQWAKLGQDIDDGEPVDEPHLEEMPGEELDESAVTMAEEAEIARATDGQATLEMDPEPVVAEEVEEMEEALAPPPVLAEAVESQDDTASLADLEATEATLTAAAVKKAIRKKKKFPWIKLTLLLVVTGGAGAAVFMFLPGMGFTLLQNQLPTTMGWAVGGGLAGFFLFSSLLIMMFGRRTVKSKPSKLKAAAVPLVAAESLEEFPDIDDLEDADFVTARPEEAFPDIEDSESVEEPEPEPADELPADVEDVVAEPAPMDVRDTSHSLLDFILDDEGGSEAEDEIPHESGKKAAPDVTQKITTIPADGPSDEDAGDAQSISEEHKDHSLLDFILDDEEEPE